MLPKPTCFLVIFVIIIITKPNTLTCEVAVIEEFPYIVLVNGGKINDCLGILIHSEYVITLAECFEGNSTAKVVLRYDASNLLQRRDILIDHSRKVLFNDLLALVQLENLLYLKEPIQKATLLTKTESLMLKSLSQRSSVQATILSSSSNNVMPRQIHLLDQDICNYFYGINSSSGGKYCIRYDTFPDAKLEYKMGTPATLGGKVFGLLLPPKKNLEGELFRFVLSLEPLLDWIEKETQAFQHLQFQDQITSLEKRINNYMISSIQDMKQEIARALDRISKLEQKGNMNNALTEDPFYFSGSGSDDGEFSDGT